MKDNLTPLMRQYQKIKQNYKEAVLFFRLGDFYEMFGEDAKKASPVLGIALTSRQKVPMCGVPYHTAVNYVAKLIRAGYPVAICEQMEEKTELAKGIVKREVVRLITPGTILEENLLEAKNNNYLFALYPENKDNHHSYGIVFLDLSTGEFRGTEIKNDSAELAEQKLAIELARFTPREGLLPRSEEKNTRLVNLLKNKNIRITFYDDWKVDSGLGADYFKEKLKIVSLKGLGIEDKKLFLSAGVALLNYLEETQKIIPEHLKEVIASPVNFYSSDEYLALDETAIRNLELLECSATRSKKGSLLEVIDKTLTAMGGRMLRFWLTHPLKEIKSIRGRQKIVSFFVEENILREQLREEIKKVCDLERLVSRLSFNQSNARDLVALKNSLKLVPEIKKIVTSRREIIGDERNFADEFHPANSPIGELIQKLVELPEIIDLIDKTIIEEPPVELKEGGIIKKGYSPELDNLMGTRRENKQWISELEKKERERTGISSLKVGYTTVFGYYLEVTKPNLSSVPPDYIRKQTLVNAERFITPELKEKETFIFSAEERINRLEYEIYQTIRSEVVKKVKEIQTIAKCLAEIDVYLSLALVARENNYTQPEVNDSLFIEIKDGRHPVVEKNLLTNQFVPNDTYLDSEENQILIITGPNMAGKSTYIRQVALIVILGQMGSFVPAKEAKVGLVDRIFTRIGAAENLPAGESTFMVEMQETANILNNTTPHSLLILDEIGRGTSTYDGISIAWATVEFLAKNQERRARTLFATHYFELTELENLLSGVKNYNVSVKEWGEEIIFLHKIIPGAADRSYGIQVAKLAGLPEKVISRAEEIMYNLEKDNLPKKQTKNNQLDFLVSQTHPLVAEIEKIDPEKVTPIDALLKIKQWKERYKK